jgi:hypothetical protein
MGNGNPGSVKGNQFVVADIGEAAAYLDRVGVENSGVMHVEDGVMKPGPDPEGREFGSFVFFDDPDGNTGPSKRT